MVGEFATKTDKSYKVNSKVNLIKLISKMRIFQSSKNKLIS